MLGLSRSCRFPFELVLVLAVCGCTVVQDRTQVMAVIGAEEALIEATTELRVRARGGADLSSLGEPIEQRFTGDALEWPLRIALLPGDDDATRVYELSVSALDRTGVLSTAIARGGYVEGKTLALPLTIGSCTPACSDGESCEVLDEQARCREPTWRDPLRLSDYDADDLPQVIIGTGDAGGTELDAGLDSSLSDGSDADADATATAQPEGGVPYELSIDAADDNLRVVGVVADGWEVTIDWDDGRSDVVEGSVDIGHTYRSPGSRDVRLSASADDGEQTNETRTVVLRFVPSDYEVYLPLSMSTPGCSIDLSGLGAAPFRDRYGNSAQACHVQASEQSAAQSPSVDMGSDVTIVGWAQLTGTLQSAVVFGRGSLPAIVTESNAIAFAVDFNGSVTSESLPVADARWHFYAGVLESTDGFSTTLRFHVDSTTRSQVLSGWTNETDDCLLRVGGGTSDELGDGHCALYGSGAFQTGSYDDVRVYNRALSAEEIRIIYELERP